MQKTAGSNTNPHGGQVRGNQCDYLRDSNADWQPVRTIATIPPFHKKGERVLKKIHVVIFISLVLMGNFPAEAEFINTPIRMEHFPPYYYPHEAVVWAGVPVQWMNATASPHTVQHDDCGTEKPCLFDSGKVAPGKTYTLPGLPPGRYSYHCQIHPIMGGMLIVEDSKGRDSPPQ